MGSLGPLILIVLGGSWAVISRVISRITILVTHIRGLITLLTTSHEPPSGACGGLRLLVGGPHRG